MIDRTTEVFSIPAALLLSSFIFQKKLQEVIEREEAAGRILNREEPREEKQKRQQFQNKLDMEDQDYIIQGAQTTRVSRKQVIQIIFIV